MRLNKSEREYSNKLAFMFGLLSVGLFWLAMFTSYHLYLWAIGVGWHLLLVTFIVFIFYLVGYRWNFRMQMSKTKEYYSKEKRRKTREST